MKVTRAVGEGLKITHNSWPVIAVLFIFCGILRSFSIPHETGSPYPSLKELLAILGLFTVSALGFSYFSAGVLAFARDAVTRGGYGFGRFFGNCNSYFIRLFYINLIIGIPLWFLTAILAVLLGGVAEMIRRNLLSAGFLLIVSVVDFALLMGFFVLSSFSWTVTVADNGKIFRSIKRSFVFSAKRFFHIIGLMSLIFLIMIAVFWVAGVAYMFFIYGLRRAEMTGLDPFLREAIGCFLNVYFWMLIASSFMAYYLNNNRTSEQIGAA